MWEQQENEREGVIKIAKRDDRKRTEIGRRKRDGMGLVIGCGEEERSDDGCTWIIIEVERARAEASRGTMSE
jgi:hypothetical protein